MAKQKSKNIIQVEEIQSMETEKIAKNKNIQWYNKILNGFIPYGIIMALSLLIYSNTFNHQYALDDEIVICKNEFVLQGIKGLPDIFSKDLYHSFYEQMNTTAQLSGGRYRPLSVASFAIEQEFIGTREDANFDVNTIWDFNENGKQDPNEDVNEDGLWNQRDFQSKGFGFRHVMNVIFYGLTCCMLFVFLSQIVFKKNRLLAFIVSLLFLAHPIHTEVVANVKSRDEIFSLFFMLLTIWMAHQYDLKQKAKFIWFTGFSFFAAILSKEYGATLLVLVPLSLYLFGEQKFNLSNQIKTFGAMIASFALYLMIRAKNDLLSGKSDIQDAEILNNPFKLASESQALATKLFIFLKYLGTLIFPHPLSCDYGYNSIPYKDFSMPIVWLSILLLFAFGLVALYFLKKKNWVAFAIAFYMGTILLVTNLIFNVGATMGERLAFHSSVGFCMVLGYGMFWLAQKMKQPLLVYLFMLPVFILYAFKTYVRNPAWENDITLSLTDVKSQPESISLNGNACSRYIDLSESPMNKSKEKEYLNKAILYGNKALSMHPEFVNGYMNIGLAYAKLDMLDSAKNVWKKAFTLYPSHPQRGVYFNLLSQTYSKKAYDFAKQQDWLKGRELLGKALEFDTLNARLWYDYGGFSFQGKDMNSAKLAWRKAYQLNSKDTDIIRVQALVQ